MKAIRRVKWAVAFAILIGLVTAPRARKLHSPDFKVFYTAAQHALHSPEKIYSDSPDLYLYPPSTALLLTPFSFSENYEFHQWAWHLLLVAVIAWLCSFGGAALFAMALLTRYLAVSLGYGQINLVVMGLLAGAGIFLAKRPQLAGGFWALATSLKIYPLAFAPAFFPEKNRKGILGAAALGALLLGLPFFLYGSLGWQLYQDFFGILGVKGFPLHSHNQSFSALLQRLFTDQTFKLHTIGDTQWTLLALPPASVRALAFCVGATLSALSWKKAFARKENPWALLSATAFCIIFLSHIVWKDYLLFLFFPLKDYFDRSSRKESLLLAIPFLLLVTLSGPDILGTPIAARLDASCIHLWAGVLVWIAWLKR